MSQLIFYLFGEGRAKLLSHPVQPISFMIRPRIRKVHSRSMYEKLTDKYNGPIPYHVSHPIRAGLLLGVKRDHLLNLVRSLDPVKQAPNPIDLANKYIESIAKYDRVILADNCFWSDGSSSSRSKGGKQPTTKAATAGEVSAFFKIEKDRRRPSHLFKFDHKAGTKNGKKPRSDAPLRSDAAAGPPPICADSAAECGLPLSSEPVVDEDAHHDLGDTDSKAGDHSVVVEPHVG